MDPLSDVLSLLQLRSYTSGGFQMGGDWSIRFGQHDGIKCYAAVSGACWLCVDGVAEPIRVEAGDCFLLPRGWPFHITNDLGLTPVDARTIFTGKRDGGMIVHNGGGGFFCAGGHFALSGVYAQTLRQSLPPVVHIHSEADKTMLRWCLERMRQELSEPRPGGFLVAQQLATMLLVQALRLHLSDASESGVGWLFALGDKQMSAAIHAMHDEPARRWTVQSMAECAGMSRTSFTLRFKEIVGTSPMDYLTRWRMALGANRLTNASESIASIALSLGYESESAFSTAFKRVMGCSPRQHTRSGVANAA